MCCRVPERRLGAFALRAAKNSSIGRVLPSPVSRPHGDWAASARGNENWLRSGFDVGPITGSTATSVAEGRTREELPRKDFGSQPGTARDSTECSIKSREGDTIVVWKLGRLTRSTRSLLDTMEAIREAGGKFQSMSEPWADTTPQARRMLMTKFAGIAEFERDLIRERPSARRVAGQKRGGQFGRPRKLNLDQAKLAKRLLDEGKSTLPQSTGLLRNNWSEPA